MWSYEYLPGPGRRAGHNTVRDLTQVPIRKFLPRSFSAVWGEEELGGSSEPIWVSSCTQNSRMNGMPKLQQLWVRVKKGGIHRLTLLELPYSTQRLQLLRVQPPAHPITTAPTPRRTGHLPGKISLAIRAQAKWG